MTDIVCVLLFQFFVLSIRAVDCRLFYKTVKKFLRYLHKNRTRSNGQRAKVEYFIFYGHCVTCSERKVKSESQMNERVTNKEGKYKGLGQIARVIRAGQGEGRTIIIFQGELVIKNVFSLTNKNFKLMRLSKRFSLRKHFILHQENMNT